MFLFEDAEKHFRFEVLAVVMLKLQSSGMLTVLGK
jgi:hypothetical protein